MPNAHQSRQKSEKDTFEQARDCAVQAAYEAGHLIRFHAGRLQSGDVSEKAMHDVVTDIDVASQNLVVSHLKEAFPDSHILAEEEDRSVKTALSKDAWRWIIDPIDGTTNFTRGIPPYAVSIGLEVGDTMHVGVVYDVAHDDLYTAIRGRGFYMNGRRQQVSMTPSLEQSILATGYPYRSFGHIDEYLGVLRSFMEKARGVRRPGAASIDLAYVAAGRFDGFFETGLHPWDMAAGLVLIEEAGGRVTDFFDAPYPVYGNQILATNGTIHQEMLAVLEPLKEIATR